MRAIFLDTVGMLATFDKRDQWHQRANSIYTQLKVERVLFFTSEFVLLECANAASRTQSRSSVIELRETLTEAGCVLSPTESELSAAWQTYKEGKPGQPGVVDLISFRMMKRYGITEAFTNDVHFRAAGFVTLF